MKANRQHGDRRLQVLFILHQASLTGAPIILVELAWALLRTEGFAGRFLVMQDGPLLSRCRAVADTRLWIVENRDRQFRKWGFLGKLAERVYYAFRHRRIISEIRNSDVIVSNTIANGAILDRLSFLDIPVISYIHELPFAVKSVTTPATLRQVIAHTTFFLAGSEAVRRHLVSGLGVREEKTAVLYSSLPTRSFSREEKLANQQLFRKNHLVKEGTYIVGVASSAEWRKGFDLWFPLVRIFCSRYPHRKVVFVWKGYRGSLETLYSDLFDFRKVGLEESVIILPHDGDSVQTMAAFDVHLLLSREDPYPLVVLEAACMGIPTLCFRDSGGTPEFVEDDAGVCVPYGNLAAMADALEYMLGNPDKLLEMGAHAQRKVVERHDVGLAASRMAAIIRDVVPGDGLLPAGEPGQGKPEPLYTDELI